MLLGIFDLAQANKLDYAASMRLMLKAVLVSPQFLFRVTRRFVVGRVRRCIDAGVLAGNETDIAHVLVSMTQGLAATEIAGWLGTSRASINRRWDLAIHAVLDGLAGPMASQRSNVAAS